MNATLAPKLSLVAFTLALSAIGCASQEATEGDTATGASAATSTDCYANVTPGTDNPGADPDSLCVITADLGAKLRSEASASSEDMLASVGWGGLPCGYQFHVDLRHEGSAVLGKEALGCSIWSYGTAIVNGDEMSGYINASLFKCRSQHETNEEFLKRFTPTCTDFSNESGLSQSTDACVPEAGWTKMASHDGIRLHDGAGADAALVTTKSPTKVAAIFKAYRQNAKGQTDYVGCFRTNGSGTYGAHVSAAYTVNTTEGFYEYEGANKRYATWADVDYYVVQGNASIY